MHHQIWFGQKFQKLYINYNIFKDCGGSLRTTPRSSRYNIIYYSFLLEKIDRGKVKKTWGHNLWPQAKNYILILGSYLSSHMFTWHKYAINCVPVIECYKLTRGYIARASKKIQKV